jgi:hypothetical protein
LIPFRFDCFRLSNFRRNVFFFSFIQRNILTLSSALLVKIGESPKFFGFVQQNPFLFGLGGLSSPAQTSLSITEVTDLLRFTSKHI